MLSIPGPLHEGVIDTLVLVAEPTSGPSGALSGKLPSIHRSIDDTNDCSQLDWCSLGPMPADQSLLMSSLAIAPATLTRYTRTNASKREP
jgi:hypothetical protein